MIESFVSVTIIYNLLSDFYRFKPSFIYNNFDGVIDEMYYGSQIPVTAWKVSVFWILKTSENLLYHWNLWSLVNLEHDIVEAWNLTRLEYLKVTIVLYKKVHENYCYYCLLLILSNEICNIYIHAI